jgi:Fe-S-cluster formation regulator IscX/YfhJ
MQLLEQIKHLKAPEIESDLDPKDLLITALRHQVVTLRTESKNLEAKMERLLKTIQVEDACTVLDFWDGEDSASNEAGEIESNFSSYSDLLQESYAELSPDTMVFYLKSRLLQ